MVRASGAPGLALGQSWAPLFTPPGAPAWAAWSGPWGRSLVRCYHRAPRRGPPSHRAHKRARRQSSRRLRTNGPSRRQPSSTRTYRALPSARSTRSSTFLSRLRAKVCSTSVIDLTNARVTSRRTSACLMLAWAAAEPDCISVTTSPGPGATRAGVNTCAYRRETDLRPRIFTGIAQRRGRIPTTQARARGTATRE